MQSAHVIELPNTTADVEGTIVKKLKDIGYDPETKGHLFWKKNKIDGYYVFNGVVIPSVGPQKLDLYFKSMEKNSTERNSSTLYMLVSTGENNFSSPDKDTDLWNRSGDFLNSFTDKTVAFSLEQQITQQETVLTEAQNKLSTLQNNEKELNEKLKKAQDDLSNNQTNQKNEQTNIDNQTKMLNDLKLKRKA